MKKGKFVVIYGANNIGKSTQVNLLVNRLRKIGKKVKKLKYPIYDLEPTGSIVNKFLRKNLKLSEFEAQYIFDRNRKDFQPELEQMIAKGIWVVAEDYRGTSICWGATHGISLNKMIKLNSEVYPEDLVILMDGRQFKEAIEKGHHNEDSKMWEKGRQMHLKVGRMLGWKKVKSDDSADIVAENIWKIVEKELK